MHPDITNRVLYGIYSVHGSGCNMLSLILYYRLVCVSCTAFMYFYTGQYCCRFYSTFEVSDHTTRQNVCHVNE